MKSAKTVVLGLILVISSACKEGVDSKASAAYTKIYADGAVAGGDVGSLVPEDSYDGNLNTYFIAGTVNLGDEVYIAYEFGQAENIDYIALVDDYTDEYNMGDLEIFVSSDSTNGIDGTWQSVTTMDASRSSEFSGGDGVVEINKSGVRWLKLHMTYNGTGAYGGTPAFYLSEISFYKAQ